MTSDIGQIPRMPEPDSPPKSTRLTSVGGNVGVGVLVGGMGVSVGVGGGGVFVGVGSGVLVGVGVGSGGGDTKNVVKLCHKALMP